jgi:hypothetical protein
VTAPAALVCTGRPVRRYNNAPVGEPCNARYQLPEEYQRLAIESARVAGWRVGPARPDGTRPAMCPDCARPGDTEPADQAAILVPLPGL